MIDTGEFVRYLEAKQALDDRSLNPRVLSALSAACAPAPNVLDLGCGLGSNLKRLMGAGVLRAGGDQPARYTGVDRDPALIAQAEAHAAALDWERRAPDLIQGAHGAVQVRFRVGDALNLAPHAPEGGWSLITAHAFLDLLDLDEALNAILPHLAPGGLAYFTLGFDDLTAIEPTIDSDLDEAVLAHYHASMYAQRWGSDAGERRSGRRLFHALTRRGLEILEMGPSDWVIAPIRGHYRDADRIVLDYLLTHIERVVRAVGTLPDHSLTAWFAERGRQIERAELLYIAHQTDILGKRGA